MKAILQLRLSGYWPASEDQSEEVMQIELWKDIELPSIPFVGLKIIVDSICDNDPGVEKFDKLFDEFMRQTNTPVLPLFPIESVTYNVDQHVVYATISYPFPPDNIVALRTLAELLIVGYGFYRM